MKTNILKKLFAKLATFSLLVTMLAPFGVGTARADDFNLSIGVNILSGGFTITSVAVDGFGNPIFEEHKNAEDDCGPNVGGYYRCDFLSLAGGIYDITFDEVGGYQEPIDTTVELDVNKTLLFDYLSPGYDLTVGVNILSGGFTVTSAAVDGFGIPLFEEHKNADTDCGPIDGGYYRCSFLSLDGGTYDITFDEVGGYQEPIDTTVELDVNKTLLFDYLSPGYDLTVGVNILSGGFTVTSAAVDGFGIPLFEEHKNAETDCGPNVGGYYRCQFLDLDGGVYDITFDEVAGYQEPSDATVELDANKTLLFEYLSTSGALVVGVNLASGGFTVTSAAVDGFGFPLFEEHKNAGTDCSPLDGGYHKCTFNVDLGVYDIVFDDVASYITPTDVTVELHAEGAEILRFYSSFPSGTIQVDVIDEYGVEITSVPSNHWELRLCTNENPTTCNPIDVVMTGGPGFMQNELQYGWYRLFVDSVPLPGYAYADIFNTVNSTPATELTASTDFIVFTIQYHEETISPTEIEIRAKKDGTLTNVDFIYCVGDIASPGTLACEAMQSTTDTIDAISETSTEQGIFIHREAGFQTPYNEDVGTSALAQDVVVTGFEDYYYYPITGEELADERITMAYNQVPPEAIINVEIDGPASMASAEISISGGIANHVSIDNGDNQDFDVNSSIDYVVTCHDVAGYFTLTPTIDVNGLMVAETRSVICRYADDVAFVNFGTLTNETIPQPLPAQATFVATDPVGIDDQTQATTVVDTDGTDTYYRLSTTTDPIPNNVENRFILETDTTGYTPNVDGYIQCLPAPGGFHAPDNVILINNLHILTGEEEFAGLCEYYEVPVEDQVDITIDTIGIEETAIYVDGVEVRATDDDSEISVTITTEEAHTITFEDKDPANFRTPDPIAIPAGTLDSTMSPHYLGYYVELGYETVVEIDTINESGFAYMALSPSGTQYMVGYATPGDVITIVVDNRNYHEFSFQDKNFDIPPYVLSAVPAAGCTVVTNTPETLSTTVVGTDTIIVRFQEYYLCDGTTTTLPPVVSLTGHYIEKVNAAFFRAKTTNTSPDIHGNITFTLGEPNVDNVSDPGSNTWTNIFVSDVENDIDDAVTFESPITVLTQDYIADPTDYQLTDFPASDALNELTSTYVLDEGLVDVAIRLVSFDPLIQPTAGLEVVMDDGLIDETTEFTVLDGIDIEAQFENVDSTSTHVFECPAIPGLAPPNTVYVPAGTMTDGAENVFYCLYASSAGGAEIQILTTADDQINLEAPITLDAEGTDYNLGYTNGSVATDEANMELWIEATQLNTIRYGDVAGYITPADEVVSVTPGTSYLDFDPDPALNPNIFVGLYTRGGTINVYTMDEVTAAVDGVDDAIIMLTNLTDATPAIELVGIGGTGYIEDVQVDADADYMISFGSHPTDTGYATPLPIYFNLSNGDVRSYLGVYVKNECQVDLRREDINTGDPLAAEVMLSVDGGVEYSIGTGNPADEYLVSFLIDETQANDTYEFRFVPLPAPLDIVNPPTLGLPEDSMTCPVERTIYYGTDEGGDESDFVITLLEQTITEDPVPNADVTLNSTDVETSDVLGQVTFTSVATDAGITFSFADHPTDPTGFVTPLDLVYPADAFASGETHELTVYYVPVSCAVTLDIETLDEDTQLINVNGGISLITNGGTPLFLGVGTASVIVCFNDDIQIDWGPTSPASEYFEPATDPQTVDFTGVVAGDTVDVIGLYQRSDYIPLDFTVEAEDQNAVALNQAFTYEGVPGTTPHSFQVMYEDLDSYTITFSDLAGHVTPGDVVVTDNVIAVPAGVTVTVNGLAYVVGTELQEGDAVNILATYDALISVTKTVSTETIVNNNVRANYTILVTNNSGSDIDVTLHDTISDVAGTLFGTNGGTMTIVTQGGDNTVCYNPLNPIIPLPTCPDIVSVDQTFTIGAGLAVMITYQLLSNNTGIPTGQNSTFTNTVEATYTDGAEITVDAEVSAVVSSPPTSGGGGGGGGTTGGGGGHILINGDMELEVEKLVSLDGTNYIDASDTDSALGIPENRDSRVYVKVRLTNVGQVSAVNIEYQQSFDEGDSVITAGDPENVENVNSYDESSKIMEIDLIPVNSTHEFTYEIMVSERGANGEYASDDIELLGFESRLPASQDFMTYMGIGDKYPSYMIAGDIQGNVSQDEFLRLTVESDKDEASIGDIVNFTITAENISDMDLTGLMVAHDYDESALEILNVYGGRDNGREVDWTRAILRPGETATFQIQARVSGSAPVGDFVRGMTRGLVDQSDGIAPVPNSIYIIGGVNLADTGAAMQLAQTGPGMILLLLLASLLSYLGYGVVSRQRYVMIKKAALRPL